jgi:multiple sugar transport system substrate-binding protein/sn-glycerol 3-phosphate transport system substrate-binding protein
MRKLLLLVLLALLALSAAGVSAQATSTPTPAGPPTATPTPLPPLEVKATFADLPGDSNNFAGVDPKGVTLKYWHQYANPRQQANLQGIADAFNASNPYGIKVEITSQGGYNDIRSKANAAITSGDTPNLVAGYNNDALSYALDDTVVDLTPYLTDTKWGISADGQKELNFGALDAFLIDGKRLGWVNQISANVVVYNTGVLKQLGMDKVPASLDEFKDAACKASKSDLKGAEGGKMQGFPIVADSSQYESFVASIGGTIFKDGKWDFNNEQTIAIFQFLQDLYKNGCGYIPQENFGNTNDFARGLNPMALGSTAGIPIIIGGIKTAKDAVTEWTVDVTPPLKAGDKAALQLFTPGIIMLKSTPEQQLASWLFLRFFAQADVSQQWAEAMGFFPVNLTAAKNLKAPNPYYAIVNDMLATGKVNVYQSPAQLSYGKVRSLVATAIADVTSGGKPVADVAKQLTDDANAALAESKK